MKIEPSLLTPEAIRSIREEALPSLSSGTAATLVMKLLAHAEALEASNAELLQALLTSLEVPITTALRQHVRARFEKELYPGRFMVQRAAGLLDALQDALTGMWRYEPDGTCSVTMRRATAERLKAVAKDPEHVGVALLTRLHALRNALEMVFRRGLAAEVEWEGQQRALVDVVRELLKNENML